MSRERYVLVADDEPVVQKLLGRILERDGARVALASSLQSAEALLDAGEPFDTVFLDATLGPVGCTPLLRRLVALDAPPAVVLISGRLLDPEPQALLDELGGTFLHKPFGPQALLEAAGTARKRSSRV